MNRFRFVLVLACVAAFAAVGAVSAQSGDMPEVQLSLDQCLRMALENNLELISAKYAPSMAEQDVIFRDATFDMNLNASASYRESQSAPQQLSTTTGSKTPAAAVGVDQFMKHGGTAKVDWFLQNSEIAGANVVAPSSFFSTLRMDYRLPIIKGFGSTVNTEFLVLAQNDLEISRYDLERQAELTIERVEGAYWDVVAAREAVRIAKLSLGRAQDLLDLNKKKVEVGTLAQIEITQAEAGVASQEEDVIVAEATLGDAEDELRRLLAIPAADPMWDASILNSTQPDFEERKIDLSAAIEEALVSRPEIYTTQQTFKNRELNEKVAKRQIRHQLDLVAVYGFTGASQDSVIPGFENTGNIEDAISATFDNDQFDWNVGLTYKYPFGNRAAKATYARARLAREQSGVDMSNQEQTIRVEVRSAVRAVDSGIKRVNAAQKNVQLQQEKLDAEQKKFDNGMSTSFEVLTFQNDLADAELAEIRARLDYIKSVTALERSKGTLLEARGLTIDERTM